MARIAQKGGLAVVVTGDPTATQFAPSQVACCFS